MNSNGENDSTERKIFISLAVLVFSIMAFTSAGFAYTASIDGTGSLSDSEYYYVSFQKDNLSANVDFDGKICFTTNITPTSHTYTISSEDVLLFSVYSINKDPAVEQKFKINLDGCSAMVYSDKELKNPVNINVSVVMANGDLNGLATSHRLMLVLDSEENFTQAQADATYYVSIVVASDAE